jgi:type IV fimbrial biogenesis protein FimT
MGFSLVELMVTVSLVAILAGLAAPSFQAQIDNSRLGSHSSTLMSSLLFARSEAIKRNTRVVLCKSADGESCTTSGDWQQGWIIFVDADNNATRATTEQVVQQMPALSGTFKLSGNTNIANYVSYAGVGSALLTGGGFQAGTFTLCKISATGGDSREIIINATGRPRTEKSSVTSCT